MNTTETGAETATGISRERLEQALQHSTFAQLLGAELLDFAPGKVSLQVHSRPDLCQHHGYMHGAVVGFMVDSGCAWAAASMVGDVVTSEYKLNLLAPALGERLICRSEVLKAGQRQAVCRADVFAVKDGTEKLIATGLATIARV
ncbi:PaaI family thioesterase [Pseudomonas sp. PDM15]|uniref:PaaI family thioesterase n=1 Tax=Pseudomonas sp. PDM15 TaxID=2769303 RepID=UPI0017850741|nr:PaaI family thioesterase [Pseudomonas sp. PDM15]MBD9424090.1 PaaI family thioesterase [Pseudomonas sp. PDM15]